MLIVKLWHYLRGYVIINVKGRHLERLINLIHNNNILIWDIVKTSSEALEAKIEIADYQKVMELAERLSCSVEIIKKSGMTLWKWRLKTRRIFAISLVFVVIAVYLISSMVLTVDVKGENANKDALIKEFEGYGLKSWVLKRSVDLEAVKKDFLRNHRDVEFINIDYNGTKAIIDLVSSEDKQKIYDKSIPVDIIAGKDGIIKDMLVIHGTPKVEIGQQVKEGDLLVKGELLSQKGEKELEVRPIHAMAKVMAETNYHKKYEVRKYKVISADKYKINRIFHIGNLMINFLGSEENYYFFDHQERQLRIFGKELPISMDRIKYYSKENCIEKTPQELEEEVTERVNVDFRKIGQVQNIVVNSSTEKNNVKEYDINIIMIEEIGQEKKIVEEE